MDPTGTQDCISKVERTLAKHKAHFSEMTSIIHQIIQQLSRLSSSPLAEAQSPAPAFPSCAPAGEPEPKISPPERYSGDPFSCRVFLTIPIVWITTPFVPTKHSKVAYVLSLLSGHAQLWGTMEWNWRSEACMSFKRFPDLLTCPNQRKKQPRPSYTSHKVLDSSQNTP